MKKISIAMYSTFYGNGYKAPIINALASRLIEINKFEKGYGIKGLRKASNSLNIKLSSIPMMVAFIIRKVSKFFGINDKYNYLLGEFSTGIIFSGKVAKDDSNIIYVKPRPYRIISKAKSKNKYVIIDAGEMHPKHTLQVCRYEREKFGLKYKSIYENKYAVNQFEKSLKLADKIILNSNASLISYRENGIDNNKLLVLNLGIDNISNNQKCCISKGKEMAFFCTAFHSIVKGTHRLLLAWEKSNTNSKLFIVGGIRKDMQEFINKYGPFKNVIFTGALNREELFNLYNEYNPVGVLLSFSEGYGRSVAEYLNLGIPVIVSPVSTCDLIENGKQGIIVDPTDEEEIVKYIQLLSSDFSFYSRMKNDCNKTKIPSTSDYVESLVGYIGSEVNG